MHQVPIKWLQDVTHLDYATDNRFSLRVYNIQEEYLFRCSTEQAAKNWVQTLRNAQEAVQRMEGMQAFRQAYGINHTPEQGVAAMKGMMDMLPQLRR